MLRTLKKFAWTLGAGVFLVFILLAVNQLIALHANLSTIHPMLALVVTAMLALILLAAFITPVIILLRLPKAVDFPDDPSEVETYRKELQKRLSRNKYVREAGLDVYKEDEYARALVLLDGKAREVIKATAGSVFLTTAISQNGKLDALTVLVTQTRMVWQIAHIYWQRPTVRDMATLYGNVAGTALLASEIEDMDISRQIEPIVSSLVNSPGRSIPVVGHAAHIITDSLLEGSTNAFLTLRVGIVAMKYCGKAEVLDRKFLRRNSFIEASVMLRSLVVSSSGKVIAGVMRAMKDAGKRSIRSGIDSIGRVTGKMASGVGNAVRTVTGKRKDQGADAAIE